MATPTRHSPRSHTSPETPATATPGAGAAAAAASTPRMSTRRTDGDHLSRSKRKARHRSGSTSTKTTTPRKRARESPPPQLASLDATDIPAPRATPRSTVIHAAGSPEHPRPARSGNKKGALMAVGIQIQQLTALARDRVQRGDRATAARVLSVLIPKAAELASRGQDKDGVADFACRAGIELLRSSAPSHLNTCGTLLNVMKLLCLGESEARRLLELEHAVVQCQHGRTSEALTLLRAAAQSAIGTETESMYEAYVGLVEAAMWEAATRTARDPSARAHAIAATESLERSVATSNLAAQPISPAVIVRLVQMLHATQGPEAASSALDSCESNHPRDLTVLQLQCRAHAASDSMPSARGLDLLARLARADPVNPELGHAVRLVLSHRDSRSGSKRLGNLVLDPRQASVAALMRVQVSSQGDAADAAGAASSAAVGVDPAHVAGGSRSGGAPLASNEYLETPVYATSYEEVAIEYTASCIEYHNPDNRAKAVALWAELARVLQRVSSSFVPALSKHARTLPCWSSRLSWWPTTYFAPHHPAETAHNAGTDAILRGHMRTCAMLICGADVAKHV